MRTSDAGGVGHARHRHGRRRGARARARAGLGRAASGAASGGSSASGSGRGNHAQAIAQVRGGDAASDYASPIVHRLAQVRIGRVITNTNASTNTTIVVESTIGGVVVLVAVIIVNDFQQDGDVPAAMSTEPDGLYVF